MDSKARKAILAASLVVLAGAVARAQPADPIADLLEKNAAPAAAPQAVVVRQTTLRPL